MDAAELQACVEGYTRRQRERERERADRVAAAERALPALAARCRVYGATRVRVFGSLSTRRFGPHPDIDLAIEAVAPDRFFALYGELLALAPLAVDLVDLDSAPPALRDAISRDGIDL
jgi:predicted nucleotidyltransferase